MYKGDEKVLLVGHSIYSNHTMILEEEHEHERIYTVKDFIFSRPTGEQDNLQAVDFDGGPMLYIGDKLKSADGKKEYCLTKITPIEGYCKLTFSEIYDIR